jgi:hypothetical protein
MLYNRSKGKIDPNERTRVKTWNYRVMVDGDGTYSLREVYYDENKKIEGWTDECMPIGESLEEIISDLKYMQQAIMRPILVETEIVTEKVEEMKSELSIEVDEDGSETNQETND